jgi:hypothetical protein
LKRLPLEVIDGQIFINAAHELHDGAASLLGSSPRGFKPPSRDQSQEPYPTDAEGGREPDPARAQHVCGIEGDVANQQARWKRSLAVRWRVGIAT